VDEWRQILEANKPANGFAASAAGGQRSNGNAGGEGGNERDEEFGRVRVLRFIK